METVVEVDAEEILSFPTFKHVHVFEITKKSLQSCPLSREYLQVIQDVFPIVDSVQRLEMLTESRSVSSFVLDHLRRLHHHNHVNAVYLDLLNDVCV